MSGKAIVIDGKGHIEGRLAAAIAKFLLYDKKVVVVRAEEILRNGDHTFVQHQYKDFLNKRTNTNPRRGPFHERAPSQMFRRAVRGMLPYKTARGSAAFRHLKVFEGIPIKYEKRRKLVVPSALRVVSMKIGRKTTKLGDLSTSFGWSYGRIIEKMNEKRAIEAKKFNEEKKAKVSSIKNALEEVNRELGDAAVKFLETFEE